MSDSGRASRRAEKSCKYVLTLLLRDQAIWNKIKLVEDIAVLALKLQKLPLSPLFFPVQEGLKTSVMEGMGTALRGSSTVKHIGSYELVTHK